MISYIIGLRAKLPVLSSIVFPLFILSHGTRLVKSDDRFSFVRERSKINWDLTVRYGYEEKKRIATNIVGTGVLDCPKARRRNFAYGYTQVFAL